MTRSPATIVRCALADPAPAIRTVPAPARRAAGYRHTARPLLAHASTERLRAAAIERLVYTLLRPALAPLRVLSGILSRTLAATGKAP